MKRIVSNSTGHVLVENCTDQEVKKIFEFVENYNGRTDKLDVEDQDPQVRKDAEEARLEEIERLEYQNYKPSWKR